MQFITQVKTNWKCTLIIAVLIIIVGGGILAWQYGWISKISTRANLKGMVITLERGGCFGYCPIYKLTINGDGTVIYEGEEFVNIKGTRTITISEEKVRQLISEFEKIDYFSLKDSYEEYRETDMDSAITSITINGKTKIIRHYHGDENAPRELTELENNIDEIVNSNQWIK